MIRPVFDHIGLFLDKNEFIESFINPLSHNVPVRWHQNRTSYFAPYLKIDTKSSITIRDFF